MAKKITYFVPGVPGSRASPHAYTHALIARKSGPKAADALLVKHQQEWPREALWERKWFAAYESAAKLSPGDEWINHNGYKRQIDVSNIEAGKEVLARTPTADEYVEAARLKVLESIKKTHATGVGDFEVFSWHHSQQLAAKAARQIEWYCVDMQVVPCVAVDKTAKS